MNWLKIWTIGIKSLMLKPMQSSLTILGILIGVSSVIWLLAISKGVSIEYQKQLEDLGTNNIIIRTKKPSTQVTSENSGPMPYGVTRDDHEKILRIPTVEKAFQISTIILRSNFFYGSVGLLFSLTPRFFLHYLRKTKNQFGE